jgi:HlyD family secretion protein
MSELSPISAPARIVTGPDRPRGGRRLDTRLIITAFLFTAIIGLAIWYLLRPEPLLVQGEADSTRIDIAARVTGRLAKVVVARGQNVEAGASLLVIDNPELVAELRQAEAEKAVADAELQRIKVGTRPEIIAQRKAEIDRAAADLTLAQQTYNRTKQLAARQFAPQSKLDEDADALTLAQRRLDQAKLAYDEAVHGFTAEEHQIAEANVSKAAAKIDTIKALVDQLTITAPIASQVYQIPVEEGEVIVPGQPLMTLHKAGEHWASFNLREDHLDGLGIGFPIELVPADGSAPISARIDEIVPRGEFATWRAARAVGSPSFRSRIFICLVLNNQASEPAGSGRDRLV